MLAKGLTCAFENSSRRIVRARQIIYPTFEIHRQEGIKKIIREDFASKSLAERTPMERAILSAFIKPKAEIRLLNTSPLSRQINVLNERLKTLSEEEKDEIFAEACDRYPNLFFLTPDEFYRNRESLIQAYIEDNCQALCRRIMDDGGQTHYSNGYKKGYKGVFWAPGKGQGETAYFTSIANGKTYELTYGLAVFEGMEPEIFDPSNEIDVGFEVADVLPEGWDPEAGIEDEVSEGRSLGEIVMDYPMCAHVL